MKKGIDVSQYQGVINWSLVKGAGIDTVIIRCGWGMNNIDTKAVANIKGAVAAGLNVGVYWFLYGTTEEHMEKNASRFLEVVGPYMKDIKKGFWADWEGDSDSYAKKCGVTLSKNDRTNLIEVFCDECKHLGMKDVGVYLNPDYLKTKVNDLTKKYPLWLACYSSKRPSSWNPVMWQYADNGSVPGISGMVDMNEVYDGIEQKQTQKARPVVKEGMTGEFVKEMQSLLIKKGYSCGKTGADGVFGKNTKAALGAYQVDHIECGPVDFMCGPKTWASLLA